MLNIYNFIIQILEPHFIFDTRVPNSQRRRPELLSNSVTLTFFLASQT
jgi:hypothetical protein